MTIEPGYVFFFLVVKRHVCHVLQVNNISVGIKYNCILNFFEVFVLAARFYIERFDTGVYISSRDVSRFALNAANNIVDRYMLLRNLVQFQVNADDLLRHVAGQLRAAVRTGDTVARLGGDEFVVVLSDLGGRSGAVADSVSRIHEALAEPFGEMGLRSAIGVATFPSDGGSAADLLAHADRAMYVDKAERNGSWH